MTQRLRVSEPFNSLVRDNPSWICHAKAGASFFFPLLTELNFCYFQRFLQNEATQLVLQQAELLCAEWAA